MLEIERYVIEDTRNELRQEWTASFACWEARCSPTDHFTPEQCIEIYHKWGYSSDDSDEENEGFMLTTLSNDQMEALNDGLWTEDSWADAIGLWRRLHEEQKQRWEMKAGFSTQASRGVFSRHATLMKKHFGLEVHISHTHLNGKFPERWLD